jgi:hypothetical protein|tara:strand:+ start:1023 stop:1217 length:195 start_codon:yes stop_codon:yes gene_type:complete
MAKVRLLQSMAGIGFSNSVGDIVEINDPDALQRYVERGIAEIVEEKKVEKATKQVVEKKTAVKE